MKEAKVDQLDFSKHDGLIPVVIQDYRTKRVLMLAYTNELAVRETLRTGYAHFWSRSRAKLWKKGESSGHSQKVKAIRADCDRDALIYLVEQKGAACHTGQVSCFHMALPEPLAQERILRSAP